MAADRRSAFDYFAAKDHSLLSFGCFGGPPPPDHVFKRFWVVVSFEDSSDVSDYAVEHDDLETAAQEYRAIRVYDLDERIVHDVEWVQRLGERVDV